MQPNDRERYLRIGQRLGIIDRDQSRLIENQEVA